MLKNQKVESCKACYRSEESGNESYRQHSLETYKVDEKLCNELTGTDGSITPNLKIIDLKPGKLCNLNCLMCVPELSTGVESDYKKLGQRDSRDISLNGSEILWSNLKQESEYLERINISGGEPFINKQFDNFLDYLIEKSLNSNIHLSIITNLNTINRVQLEKLASFKDLSITISIDGLEKTAEFVRYPLNFKRFDQNLKELISFMNKKKPNFNLLFNTTCNVYNIEEIEQIFEYTDSLGCYVYDHNLHPIVDPKVLDITNLPDEYKKKLNKKFTQLISKSDKHKHKYQQVLNHLKLEPVSDSWDSDFNRFNQSYIKLRGFELKLNF